MEFSYAYHLPEEYIAKRPATPRDSSKLFVFDTARDEITLDRFSNLGEYIPPHSLLVLNNTKVVPARTILKKETGGKVEVLFLVNEWRNGGAIPAIVDRKITVGATVSLTTNKTFTVTKQNENIFYLKPNFPAAQLFAALRKRGAMPIPKYIKDSRMSEADLRRRYQSVFASASASVAAPTASLHLTDRLLAKLAQRGVRQTFITLDVGLGTFAPVKDENIMKNKLHEEFLNIPRNAAALIRSCKKDHNPIVAVGTTVVRALESQASAIMKARGPISGATDIFIHPPYRFAIVDAMITNFHLPESSLMMLVQAFIAQKGSSKRLTELYEFAMKHVFRFYSFGDAMLIT